MGEADRGATTSLREVAQVYRQSLIDLIPSHDVRTSVVQRVLNRNHDLARDPQVRAAMREKKGRPPAVSF